ncbi:hypothetical protein A3D00_05430 [Candidatus Woesebacteria bacterium RIFCSPHIGHO2_02_FULL_38_9]|uniref:Uncharacterized protein n=1 Tax=Candidatus Woesebacteria bacterium RIFCSPHIGHO2_01_FULL_39_28 TaxID=1802496 RepID=A0A1F7YHQ5_9BACT|nr:MAG: hypothetical protein A2627_05750 [Candidatus Woesebacteria bacterium RIFCSPHIGHO2_01_FULL_39_28]OGM33311.1 MAG: hypothetical protein A3D00_05430 [Candidatus Woesebacteria bacterium RIFCSPHIGHO2_02_FULL_38_9]OGM56674.1 MAG: hypothetical protein A3A50_04945 [Candidatus Woesebacteria bacterium RIFCSPLOWO2_01_FULL_38_20]
MSFKITPVSLSGKSQASLVQVHETNNLVVLMTLKSNVDFSQKSQIISRFDEEFFSKRGLTPFNNLRETVQKVDQEISVAAIYVDGKCVNCVVTGASQIMLFRAGVLANILEGKGTVVAASGYSKNEDVLIMGNKSFFDKVSQGELRAILFESNPTVAVEKLRLILGSIEENTAGCVMVSFEEVAEEKETKFLKIVHFLVRVLPERKIHVVPGSFENVRTSSRKTTVLVGVILLILLTVSIVFGVKQRNLKLLKSKYESRLNEARHQLDEADSLFALNPIRSKELFNQAKKTSKDLVNEGVKDERLSILEKDVVGMSGKILGEYTSEPDLFLDLSLLSSGFKGSEVIASSDKIYVLDKTGGKLVSIDFETKKTEVVAGPDQISDVLKVAVYADRTFVLTDKGIYEVTADKSGKSLVVEKDWEGEVLFSSYTGNIYLLDKSKNTIWRFSGLQNGSFGPKQKWLGSGFTVDLTKSNSMIIDGSVWILTDNELILKYALGAPISFSTSEVSPKFSKPLSIYTNEDLTGLYILDPENSRVLVFDKNGEYKASYIADKIKEAKGLVVSEKTRKAILLLDDKLYFLELKHL